MIAIRFVDAEAGFEFAAAVDEALGFPRDHAVDEPGVSWSGSPPVPHTETLCDVLSEMGGSLIVYVDEGYSNTVDGQTVTINARGGGTKEVTIQHVGAGRTPFPIENIDRSLLIREPPRGGLEGRLLAAAKGRRP